MKVRSNNFIPASEVAVLDAEQRQAVASATRAAYANRQRAMYHHGAAHGEALRSQAARAKRGALRRLPDLLEQAEANMTENGFVVRWAADAAEANRLVVEIATEHEARNAAKSKSMVTEEIGLNHALESAGIRVIETDLGEYIVQLAHETPSHIVAPILHKTKDGIRKTLMEQAGMPPLEASNEMTAFARGHLRAEFLKADLGITGGNFIIAETGSLGLVTNEGNARMVTTLPRVHVALVGIEKVVATLEDYATLTQALPRSATGQPLSVYTHLINGPRRSHERDGPEHAYVILIDNGRSRVYGGPYTEALACIRCGACLNACPVYRATGGHAYGWVYPGPIGAVVTPLLAGLEHASPLPHASSLCGSCKQVCPVDIDLPRMLLDLRHELVRRGLDDKRWRRALRWWARMNASPGRFRLAGRLASLFTRLLRLKRLPGPLRGWSEYRDNPSFAPRSFRDRWNDRPSPDA